MVTVEIEKLSDTAGAEILGLDLSKPLSSEDRDAILSALNNHHVLFLETKSYQKISR